MSAEHDQGGDYGYDLVHEAVTGLHTATPPARRPPGSPGRPARLLDPDSDFGYDQAHEV